MKEYLIYVEGVESEHWVIADSEIVAKRIIWHSLTEEEKNKTVKIECIDEREYYKEVTEY